MELIGFLHLLDTRLDERKYAKWGNVHKNYLTLISRIIDNHMIKVCYLEHTNTDLYQFWSDCDVYMMFKKKTKKQCIDWSRIKVLLWHISFYIISSAIISHSLRERQKRGNDKKNNQHYFCHLFTFSFLLHTIPPFAFHISATEISPQTVHYKQYPQVNMLH